MKQALHIFRKDLRHLWPRALLVLSLLIAHAILEVLSLPVNVPETMRINGMSGVLTWLLPVAIWSLFAWLIFEEALPGDRQFWLTRPYRWPDLLFSKVLFVFIFINIPVLISDCCILAAKGFPVFSVVPDLLLRQLFVTTLFVLPFFAIASVTTGTSQFLLAWFALLLALVFEGLIVSTWTGNTSIAIGSGSFFVATLAVATCGIVIWQYAARRTTIARLALFAIASSFPALGVLPLLFSPVTAQPRHLADQPNVSFAYDPDLNTRSQSYTSPPPGYKLVRIPLIVAGLPPKTLLRGSARISIDVGGRPWPKPGEVMMGTVERNADAYWQSLNLPVANVKVLKNQPSNLHATFDLEIVSDEVKQREPLTKHSFFVPGVGLCYVFTDTPQTQFACRAGLGPSTETSVRLDSNVPADQPFMDLPQHSVPWGLSPITDHGSSAFSDVQQGSLLAFIPRPKFTEFQRTLDLRNIQLANYMLPR